MASELSKLDVVLSKLEDVRETDTGFRARCPVHGGRSADDLGIRLGSKWINLNCFAGCTYEDIRRALDLEWSDLVVDDSESPTRRRRVSERERELTAMACALRLQNEPEVLHRLRFVRGWSKIALELLNVGWDGSRLTLPVRDAAGKLHDTLRYDPFSTQGRKVIAGKGKSRLPWPAPESIDARILFLVEGEGTALSMLSVGFWAVSLPGSMSVSTNVARPGRWMGAGWHKTWARRFEKFQHVVLFPDCDGPGRALMGAAHYDLTKEKVNAKIIDLGPKTWDGSDVADMLLRKTYDSDTRSAAKEVLRGIVAEHAELVA